MIDTKMRTDVGQLLAVGFHGTSPSDDGVKNVIAQAEAGLIGGVIIYRYNIENPRQLKELLRHFHEAQTEYPLFVMLDQEGGKVQRIRESNGFRDFRSAKSVASQCSPSEAFEHYHEMAQQLRDTGFNFNFAPCIDVDCDPPCEAIGKLERSYSSNTEVVATYAAAFIRAMRAAKIFSCVKHFPGHGSSHGDSHMGLVDITSDWRDEELNPYHALRREGLIDSVMSAHLIHHGVEKDTPITFSKTWLDKVRADIGFDGPIVTDDLHMGAILHHFPLNEIVVRALAAGHDLLIFSNNPLASQLQGIRHDENSVTSGDTAVPNLSIAERAIQEIERAVLDGRLSEELLARSIGRILDAKSTIK